VNEEHISALISLADRLVSLAEKRWSLPEVRQDAEIWKHGDPRPKAESKEEYRELPGTGPGRFSSLVNAEKLKH
jgi:hypothetical protein